MTFCVALVVHDPGVLLVIELSDSDDEYFFSLFEDF